MDSVKFHHILNHLSYHIFNFYTIKVFLSDKNRIQSVRLTRLGSFTLITSKTAEKVLLISVSNSNTANQVKQNNFQYLFEKEKSATILKIEQITIF